MATRQTRLSTVQAAERLGIDPSIVAWHCRKGNLAAEKIGRDWLISTRSVDAMLRDRPPVRRGRKKTSVSVA